MASEQFSLCWDNFHKNMSSGMNSLLENEDLVDVTLAVEGKILKAHKMVLSVCSPYFKELFKSNPCKHPIVFMKDVSYVALSDLLQFMYQGEVQVSQENLTTFIKTAEALQIKGLTGDGNGSTDEVPETTHEDRTSHHVETAPITVPRPKKIAPSPLATPPSKRQRISTSFESTPMPQPQITTKTEPVSSTPSSTDQMIQFKMEPHDQTQSMLQDDNAEDTFGDDQIEDNNAEDVEEYSMMEGNEEEPQAGTSTETAGEGQDIIVYFAHTSKNPKMIVNSFEMKMERMKKGHITWCCCLKEKYRCRARAASFGNTLRILNKMHNHPPDYERLQELASEMLRKRFKIYDESNRASSIRRRNLRHRVVRQETIEIKIEPDVNDEICEVREIKNKLRPNILQRKPSYHNQGSKNMNILSSLQLVRKTNASRIILENDKILEEGTLQNDEIEGNVKFQSKSSGELKRMNTERVLEKFNIEDPLLIEIFDENARNEIKSHVI